MALTKDTTAPKSCDIGFYYRYNLASGDIMYVQQGQAGDNWKLQTDGWYLEWQVRSGAGCTTSVAYLFQPDFSAVEARWVDHAVQPSVSAESVVGYAQDVPIGALRFTAAGGPCEVEIISKKRLNIHDGS